MEFNDLLFSSGSYFILKVIFICLISVHLLFSLIIVRQTQMMVKMVEVKISSAVYLVSVVHLLSSLFVLFWTVVYF